MKKVVFFAAFFLAFTAGAIVSAQTRFVDGKTVGHAIDQNEARRVFQEYDARQPSISASPMLARSIHAGATIQVPQADAVVVVTRNSWGATEVKVVTTTPMTGNIYTRMVVDGSGDTLNFSALQVDTQYLLYMSMWEGNLSSYLPNGNVEFQAIFDVQGKLSIAIGVVSAYSAAPAPLALTGALPGTKGSYTTYKFSGAGNASLNKSKVVGMVDYIPLAPSAFAMGPDGMLTATFQGWAPNGLIDITICRDGWCSTVTQNPPPSLTNGSGGKG